MEACSEVKHSEAIHVNLLLALVSKRLGDIVSVQLLTMLKASAERVEVVGSLNLSFLVLYDSVAAEMVLDVVMPRQLVVLDVRKTTVKEELLWCAVLANDVRAPVVFGDDALYLGRSKGEW